MKSFLPSIFLVLGLMADATAQQHKCKDCIEWSEDKKLKWSDFKARPNRLSSNAALTDSGMSIGLKCDGTTSEVTIQCFFDRSKSWTKNNESKYLLAHEQLHFDITELFVRKLRKQLAALNNDCNKLSQKVQEYYDNNYKEFVAYQQRYDSESNHSLNKEKQKYWEAKVTRELNELRPYASLASN